MQCTNCGKTGFVVVSGKRYCSSCGAKFADQGAPRAMADIKPSASRVTATAAPIAAPPITPAAAIPAPVPAQSVVVPVAKPAAQLHGTSAASNRSSVLDLRTVAKPPAPAQSDTNKELLLEAHAEDGQTAAAPVATNFATPTPITSPTLVAPVATTTASIPVATPAAPEITVPAATTAPTVAVSPALVHAPVITSQQPAAAPIVAPVVPPVDLATPASAPTAASPLVKRFPEHPAVVANPEPDDLPGQVATQLEALQAQMGIEPVSQPGQSPGITEAALAAAPQPNTQSPDLKQALEAAKPAKTAIALKMGAAMAAIAIMGGFVWLQNSPKLAFHAAANKAGIEASLPTYIPSSYHQTGNANVGDGQLTLDFRSPSSEDPLRITQKKTAWDSNSLRENYVARQSDNYVAVSGQGLTIFLYNDNASWVNHGIWYSVSGTAKLSREQILKVAYGL